MYGPYTANDDGTLSYVGNKIFKPIKDISKVKYTVKEAENRVKDFKNNEMWEHIARINHQINKSSNDFFDSIGALFTALPMTTRMISSPGAVYGREAIDYTSDTCPITLNWFDLKDKVFLSESSQIYLELALISHNLDHVYSIYNSFRKEKGDATHLSEFHHVEYEGHVDQKGNETLVLKLIKKILEDLINNNSKDLRYFLTDEQYSQMKELAKNINNIPMIPFSEALKKLYAATGKEKYKKFTMKNFGSWEEVKLTQIYGNMIAIKEFPLLEVPFYHAQVAGSNPVVANNTDFIWPGYREFVGSGHRIGSKKYLMKKAKIFNLPKNDYAPYMQSRTFAGYKDSSGFGLGWERLLQGILCMPFIWSACQFPRVDITIKP